MILAKAVVRQSKHIFQHKLLRIANCNNAPVKIVWFWPEKPHPYTVVYRVFHRLGIIIKQGVPDVKRGQTGFLWLDDTYVPPPPVSSLVNGNCLDISKEKVDAIHSRIFGYSLSVDPLMYVGRMVCKSNLNGAHDGIELAGPLKEKQADSVYQRIVDNRPADGNEKLVSDYRIAIFGGHIGFGYNKLRPKTSRFSNTNAKVSIEEDMAGVFSVHEIQKIEEFCEAFHLDYGELDVVRDYTAKDIYILDVNKTPLGPPNGLTEADHQRAFGLLVRCFLKWINSGWSSPKAGRS